MEIDISQPLGGNLSYHTADNLGILPINTKEVVDLVAPSIVFTSSTTTSDNDDAKNNCTIDNTIFTLQSSTSYPEWHGIPFPMPITIRECLTRYCDVTGTLKRSDLQMLSYYATDPVDRSFLLRLASKDGMNEYRDKILNHYIGYVDIIQLCPSIQMPLEHFLSFCPPIQVRYYTISSSSSVYPNSIHITVAVTTHDRKSNSNNSSSATNKQKTELSSTSSPSFLLSNNRSVFKGLCSNYLANCRVGIDTVRIFVRPSSFRLPTNLSTPILMIGPGTGIAPMRAMIQEREYQYQQQQQQHTDTNNVGMGNNVLYFGCKKPQEDYIYQNELQQYHQRGILHELYVAFSREIPTQKVYVQHLLKHNAQELYQLIKYQNCYIYVCGGVQMGQDVYETLQEILSSMNNDEDENKEGVEDSNKNSAFVDKTKQRTTAKEYLNQLSHEHRYVQELWA
jgi:NADPH-ferrihemoprotein reductase